VGEFVRHDDRAAARGMSPRMKNAGRRIVVAPGLFLEQVEDRSHHVVVLREQPEPRVCELLGAKLRGRIELREREAMCSRVSLSSTTFTGRSP